MAKLSIQDLKKVKEDAAKNMTIRGEKGNIKIIVHMGTCGIAAGAREVMATLMEEMNDANRQDIRVLAAGCIGMCSSEPNVTVEIKEEEPIVYQQMDRNKMRQVFKGHVLKGEVQTDFVLPRG